jgi:hypothetical protein
VLTENAYFVSENETNPPLPVVVDQVVPGRNVSLLFSGELGNGHYDALLPVQENEDRGLLTKFVFIQMAVRRVGCWCEMAASLRGREPGSRGTYTFGRYHQATH